MNKLSNVRNVFLHYAIAYYQQISFKLFNHHKHKLQLKINN